MKALKWGLFNKSNNQSYLEWLSSSTSYGGEQAPLETFFILEPRKSIARCCPEQFLKEKIYN